MAIGAHHSPKSLTQEWLTPPDLLEKLGEFDLDPCAPEDRPWDVAKKHYTLKDNGLIQPWEGRVWCNPPYGKEVDAWLKLMAKHKNGMALVFARTETKMFQDLIVPHADALLFLRGRIHFRMPDGSKGKWNSGGPSVLVSYDKESTKILDESEIPGWFVVLGDDE